MVERLSSKREEKKARDRPERKDEPDDKPDAIMIEDRELVIDTSEKIEIIQSFDQLGLNEQLLRGKSSQTSYNSIRPLFLRLQQALGGLAARHFTYHQAA